MEILDERKQNLMKLILVALALLLPQFARADGVVDKPIYQALNVPEIALPTAYPYSGFQKAVGRLACAHLTNTQTGEESFSCTLSPAR